MLTVLGYRHVLVHKETEIYCGQVVMMWISILLGMVLLIGGGEILVRGAVGVARKIGVSDLFIGAVLVGFGTSAPELVASLKAVSSNASGIAVGNVLGSNVANILLVLGVAALIHPIMTQPKALMRDGFFMLLATIVLAGLIYYNGFSSRTTGFVLVGALVLIIVTSFFSDKAASRTASPAEMHRDEAELMDGHLPIYYSIPMVIAGLAGIVFGADFLIEGAVELARSFAVSETVIGITIVAIGTSLPELVTCSIAAFKKKADVALGNVLGSNTFNVFGILGVTASVMPFNIPMDQLNMTRDLGVLALSVLFLLLFAYTGRKLARWEGAVLLIGYITYMILLVR